MKICNVQKIFGLFSLCLSLGAEAAPFREYPIGDEVDRDKEKIKVAAVYFPAVPMDHKAMGHAGHGAKHDDFNAELKKEKFVKKYL